MGRQSKDYGEQSSDDPLLPTVLSDESLATLVLVFSTLVAVSGSFVCGSAVSTLLPFPFL